MKKTIFYNIFKGYLVIILLLAFIIIFSSFNAIKKFYLESKISQLEKNAILISTQLPKTNLQSFITQTSKKIETRITIIDTNGFVLADSEKNSKSMENHKKRPEIQTALNGKTGSALRHSTTFDKDMLYVAIPFNDGIIRLSLYMNDIQTLLNKLKIHVIYSALIVTILAIIFASIFTRKISVPIQELKEAAQIISKGNFKKKIFINADNELSDLGKNFNYMTEMIDKLFTEVSTQKQKLEGIISSVNAGIVVCDDDLTIILSNKLFNDTIKITDIKILTAIREHKNCTKELTLDDKIYLVNISYNSNIIMIFHDITELKKGEQVRKDFVQNVSHELKTPLASIKAFMETLEDEKEYNQKYVEIIKNNTERMINIINDLILLSEAENPVIKLEKEPINIKESLENIAKIFEKKKLPLRIEIAELPLIQGDKFKLEQVFINLLDNAFKYTEVGEVVLSAVQENDSLKISVKDTGIGIADEQKERIFERFYVVDKSRSRKLGGNGLGLSIVKHIVLLHGGTINVESKLGFGTTFTVTL